MGKPGRSHRRAALREEAEPSTGYANVHVRLPLGVHHFFNKVLEWDAPDFECALLEALGSHIKASGPTTPDEAHVKALIDEALDELTGEPGHGYELRTPHGADPQLETRDRLEVKVTIPASLHELIKALGWDEEAYVTWAALGAAQGDMNALFPGWKRADAISRDCELLQERFKEGDWT